MEIFYSGYRGKIKQKDPMKFANFRVILHNQKAKEKLICQIPESKLLRGHKILDSSRKSIFPKKKKEKI